LRYKRAEMLRYSLLYNVRVDGPEATPELGKEARVG
jgi:hypothetical protein